MTWNKVIISHKSIQERHNMYVLVKAQTLCLCVDSFDQNLWDMWASLVGWNVHHAVNISSCRSTQLTAYLYTLWSLCPSVSCETFYRHILIIPNTIHQLIHSAEAYFHMLWQFLQYFKRQVSWLPCILLYILTCGFDWFVFLDNIVSFAFVCSV